MDLRRTERRRTGGLSRRAGRSGLLRPERQAHGAGDDRDCCEEGNTDIRFHEYLPLRNPSAFYPTPYRATGVSWANGIGRSGSIAGSLLGGVLLGSGWAATTVCALAAIPAVISPLSLATLGIVRTGGVTRHTARR
jgi:hypothetical protein